MGQVQVVYLGGKPSKGTKADKRLTDNQPVPAAKRAAAKKADPPKPPGHR